MLCRCRRWRIALLFGLLASFATHEARAADTSAGSKNFSPPTTVPNYFSNEAGPLQGPASETRRGALYMNQTYGTPRVTAVAAAPHGRQHIAMAVPRGRSIRGRVAYERRGRVVAGHRIETRGHPISHAVAHGRGRVERVAVRTHSVVHKTTHVTSAHRGRG